MNAEQQNGLIHLASSHTVDETLRRLEKLLRDHGITIFLVVDHSGEAQKVGLSMPPTKLVIFGNPKGGTPLMQAAPSSGIDLPLKALIWQDPKGKVWLSYNDPEYLRWRHGFPAELLPNISGVAKLLEKAVQQSE